MESKQKQRRLQLSVVCKVCLTCGVRYTCFFNTFTMSLGVHMATNILACILFDPSSRELLNIYFMVLAIHDSNMYMYIQCTSTILCLDFDVWKQNMEKKTNSWFVKATGKKGAIHSTTTYYYCNRSGYFTSHCKNKRHLKAQGSSKLNTYCTAAIIVRETHDDKIVVQYYPTHYGHTTMLGHLRISQNERLAIAGKLLQGVAFERIIDDVRTSMDTSINRIHLITRKDIANIQRAYGLQEAQYHKDDAISVMAWVDAMNKNTPSPVLLHKQQGQVPNSDCPSLEVSDFMLVLQTPFQAEVLNKCGPTKIICIDDTHGTNSYDFYLTTILVVDEFGEGYPTAWCLSNRTDYCVVVYFLQAVKKNVGFNITPQWVMTDDAEQFYKAWVTVFGDGPQKLLCTWHVDRAWRGAIQNKIQDKEVAALVYHNVRILMEEINVDEFEKLLHETVEQLKTSNKTKEFESYFTKYYVCRKEQWAACYRKKSGINTNMYVESFHRLIKYVYMRGRTNKRIDKLLHILMKVARDKAFERLCKLEKGKISGRLAMIRKRHAQGTQLPTNLVTQHDSTQWIVVSSEGTHEYLVCEETQECPMKCHLKCTDCSICVHSFSCNCMDALINHTICKHIHLVANSRKTKQSLASGHNTHTESTDYLLINETRTSLSETVIPNHHEEVSDIRRRVQHKLMAMMSKIQEVTNAEALISVEGHINVAMSMLNVIRDNTTRNTMPPKQLHPANKNILQQRAFFSTKHKYRKPKTRIAKPTKQEQQHIKQALFNRLSLYSHNKDELQKKAGKSINPL